MPRDARDSTLTGVMALTLWLGVIAFTILYVYLLDRRYRLAALEGEMEQREVDAAIAARIAPDPDPVEVGS